MRNINLAIVFCGLALFSCRPDFPEIVGTLDFDGKVYKTIYCPETDQTWMAENLVRGVRRPLGSTFKDDGIIEYFCFDNEPNCINCSNLLYPTAYYSWTEATQLPIDMKVPPDSIIQGVCPSGWRIPSRNDWEKLLRTKFGFSGIIPGNYSNSNKIGDKLKVNLDLWCSSVDSLNCNSSNFSIPSTGVYRYPVGSCVLNGNTFFWTSTLIDGKPYSFSINREGGFRLDNGGIQHNIEDGHATPVRCMTDGQK